ncbi:Por secretion system C-terminal sorting domain-containing protein [Draconibacterium orientale]|uniref:Alpha-amylase n=1 Tax=Draconibacterium orientale TaxID=1168034 RepID=X5DWM8_9BACT|nr:alpha-amylase family glycosyl hydrolase [Draconibacterium orientale]AHW59615.1 alpha-amylase [Draconibacterium orientale]SES82437.1 Por secretion system C-terminal sorting domain-containing protein [Draconibacterium orientale]
MFQKLHFVCLFILLFIGAQAQIITTNPALPVASQPVTITFNSAESTGLGYYTGDLYAHTGVTIEGKGQWQNVIESWGNNSTQPQLTYTGDGVYELEITPDINSFYGVEAGDKVTELCFVFRTADANNQTTDLFVTVFEEGLVVNITEPSGSSIFKANEAITFSAQSSVEADLKLSLNETVLTQTTGTEITTTHTFTESGNYWLIAEATADGETVYDSLDIFVGSEVINEPLPAGYKKGINYIDDNTAALVLWAPLKEFVYVQGDFNNWQLSNNYLMKKDGDYFWLELNNLEAGKEYAYQYLIDGNIRIADPYTEKILDPMNDSYIDEATYPNLKAYPEGKTEGIVSVLQTAQTPYNWQVTDFESPDKNKLVIYELLVRDFMTEHTYQAVIDQLDYLEDLRINVLELMPVNEFEGNSSWGYNPSFYFAPDKYYGPKNKLKELIDECHQRGIAVVIDMVLNHSYGQSPFVQMYMDNWTVTADNPWYNQQSNFQNPDAQWGYDFNHESAATRELVDSVSSFWMSEYKVDGFRFDFTKGFSNTSYGPSSWGSTYDAARIANLKRMSDEIWKRNADALVIFEHLADNSEEKELANYGIMLWGNMNYSYGETAMAYNDNINWGIYTSRGWDEPNLVTYMESHDEERIVYKCLNYGKAEGNYNTQDLATALDRAELNSVFFIPLPGPKMIWQFGERGFDQSINRCTDGSISNDCRLSEKPPYWNYLENTDRTDLFQVMAKLNELKQQYDVFSPDDAEYSLAGITKWYKLSKGDNHVVGLGNFDVTENNIVVTFPSSGKYYEFFSGDSIEVNNTNQTFTFAPGEYRLYSTQQFEEPRIITDIDEPEVMSSDLQVYPNPASSKLSIVSDKTISTVQLYSIAGTLQYQASDLRKNKLEIDMQHFTPGVYLIRVVQNGNSTTQKVLVK